MNESVARVVLAFGGVLGASVTDYVSLPDLPTTGVLGGLLVYVIREIRSTNEDRNKVYQELMDELREENQRLRKINKEGANEEKEDRDK